jgi:hypothetical protein
MSFVTARTVVSSLMVSREDYRLFEGVFAPVYPWCLLKEVPMVWFVCECAARCVRVY